MPIIPQNLNINNWRTTGEKYFKFDIIRELIEYSLKKVLAKAMLTHTVFEILLFETTISRKIFETNSSFYVK